MVFPNTCTYPVLSNVLFSETKFKHQSIKINKIGGKSNEIAYSLISQ